MKPYLLIITAVGILLASPPNQAFSQSEFEVSSPDGRLLLTLSVDSIARLRLDWNGEPLLLPSPIQLLLPARGIPSEDEQVSGSARRSQDEILRPTVPEKRAEIRDRFNEIALTFGGGWGLELRAYDSGVAYRYRYTGSEEVLVEGERFQPRFPGDPTIWIPTEDSFLTHQERLYQVRPLSEIPPDTMGSIPILIAPEDLPKVLLTESDLRSYPGLYFRGTGASGLESVFPAFPALEEQVLDRTVRVVEREPFLSRSRGPRTFPWRVLVVAEEDRELVENTLVFQLAPSLEIEDPSWIRPGKVAWDWWNANSLSGVPFRSGLNTETYLHFIDFAAENGIEYVILDEGWSNPGNLRELNFDMDLQEILRRGEERGVGIILWVVWKALADQLEEAMDQFAQWGVAGIKVDFMQRDDQPMVEYYWQVAREAAQRQLLVDFHGAYKPSGLRRAYPNVLTREGVLGLEHSKWSPQPTPEHNVTLPFIRMVAGPMDYTPGAMRNSQEQRFSAVFDRPMSLGTRAHQMAMYVVYESPLQMLSDSPSNYVREAECLGFITGVPTTWDETRVLSGEVGEWIALARRRGDTWYVAAMTDWIPRELELDLSFMNGDGWEAEIFADGPNAQDIAEDFERWEGSLDTGTPLTIHLGPGGGWVARISRPTR